MGNSRLSSVRCSVFFRSWKLTTDDTDMAKIKNDRFAIFIEGRVHIYSDENRKERIISEWDSKISCLAEISPNRYALANEDWEIIVLKCNDEHPELMNRNVMGVHDNHVTCLLMLNGCLLASGSVDSTIKIWDVNDTCLVKELENQETVANLMITPAYGLLVSQSFYQIKVWDIEAGTVVWSKSFDDLVNKTVIMLDGNLLVLTKFKFVFIFSPQDGEVIRRFKFKRETGFRSSLNVLTNGDLLAVNKDGKSIEICDSTNGQFKRALVGSEAEVVSLVVLENGLVICLSKEGSFTSWKI